MVNSKSAGSGPTLSYKKFDIIAQVDVFMIIPEFRILRMIFFRIL